VFICGTFSPLYMTLIVVMIEKAEQLESVLRHRLYNVTKQTSSNKRSINTARQQRYRQKMKDLELSLVQVWVPHECILALRSVAARMKTKSSEENEPSSLQLELAQLICERKGLSLKQEHLSSKRKLSRWIKQSQKKPNKCLTW
jgi:hypothetical protein